MTFDSLHLKPEIIQAVTELGFSVPTPVQQQVYTIVNKQVQTDLVALSQTGTGKTAAFGLPLLNTIQTSDRGIQAVILAPTRELCVQIQTELEKYAKYINGLSIVPVYGGASIQTQIRQLKSQVHIVTATPGRLRDLLDRRAIHLDHVKFLVLDEADVMLNMGFQEDLDAILEHISGQHNTWLFSATMPSSVERIAKRFMNSPVQITTGKTNETADNLSHDYFLVQHSDRYQALVKILDSNPGLFAMVFCRTKRDTQELSDYLIRDGYLADAIHGDLSQAQRDTVMGRFRSGHLRLLIATDVAARGIDVQGITHVINYHLPEDVEQYTHRTGRTARAGNNGAAYSIVSPKEQAKVKQIERFIKQKIHLRDLPGKNEIIKKRLALEFEAILNINADETALEPFLKAAPEALNNLSSSQLLSKFIYPMYEKLLKKYSTEKTRSKAKPKTGRVYLNLGTMDGLDIKSFKYLLSQQCEIPENMVFNVQMKRSASFFETEAQYQQRIEQINSNKMMFQGRRLRSEWMDHGYSDTPKSERSARSKSEKDKPYRESRERDRKPSYSKPKEFRKKRTR